MKDYRKRKLVYGVGINDADYPLYLHTVVDGKQKQLWRCPYFRKWVAVLERCYNEKCQTTKPSYIGCTICNEWIYFSNFKRWMEQQDWEGKELDKDLLVVGNKIYGPDTCVFVSPKVNKFILERNANRGEFPIGVCWHKRDQKYTSTCCSVRTGKKESLGYYDTAEEAHAAWLAFKLEQAYILAAEQTDERVAKALIDRYESYSKYFG